MGRYGKKSSNSSLNVIIYHESRFLFLSLMAVDKIGNVNVFCKKKNYFRSRFSAIINFLNKFLKYYMYVLLTAYFLIFPWMRKNSKNILLYSYLQFGNSYAQSIYF